jgi:hypothetical protein
VGAQPQRLDCVINSYRVANGIEEIHVVVPISDPYGIFGIYGEVLLQGSYRVIFGGVVTQDVYLASPGPQPVHGYRANTWNSADPLQ